MIFFSSDLHFNHDKDFIYRDRGFNDIEEYNNRILLNFHQVIGADDDLYLLGDSIMGDSEQSMKLFHQLPGKIHIVWGNHDTTRRQELISQARNVVEILGYAHLMKIQKQSVYLSHYPTMTDNYDLDKPLKRCVLNLSGHTHSTQKFFNGLPLCYNVAVDAHRCYPVSIEEIIEDVTKYRSQIQQEGGIE